MTLPGSIPLSDLRSYTLTPMLTPEDVADAGDFYIRDGWLRPSLGQGHNGTEVCYVVQLAGGDHAVRRFALVWSPMRELIVEMVLRSGCLVGPCRLVAKPLHVGMDIWVFVGTDPDGTLFDPMSGIVPPDRLDGPTVVL